jgi:2-amino-4-hydroxy-6-hydroxymethyldihydropteridine diphosphokinase
MSPLVYVSLGSNIQPEHHLRQAVQRLRQLCDVRCVSSVYRTAPQGFSEQPDFLNMAAGLTTTLPPGLFKHNVLEQIERELGRQRDPNNKNAPRTIDLDIALWGHWILEYGSKPWRVPDPDIRCFAHVALPLAEIAPDFVHPELWKTLREIAEGFEDPYFERFSL